MNTGGNLNQRRQRSGRPCSTCAYGQLDVGKLTALRLELGPGGGASLQVGDVAALSLRVRSLREGRLALVLGLGCTGNAERQRQSGQGDVSEERSHA